MGPDEVIGEIRRELAERADEETRASAQRFFKEGVSLHGVKTATVRAIGRRHFDQVKRLDTGALYALCEELLSSGLIEEAGIAADWSYRVRKRYAAGDLEVFERWIDRYVTNWAVCDTLCNHTVGAFVEQFPEALERLKAWTRSTNRWKKRAAAVSLVVPARRGRFLEEVLEIADGLLADPDDLVQKGYGWMLKEASREHQAAVLEYVVRHKDVMPRIALRYAVEKMPQELRRKAMER